MEPTSISNSAVAQNIQVGTPQIGTGIPPMSKVDPIATQVEGQEKRFVRWPQDYLQLPGNKFVLPRQERGRARSPSPRRRPFTNVASVPPTRKYGNYYGRISPGTNVPRSVQVLSKLNAKRKPASNISPRVTKPVKCVRFAEPTSVIPKLSSLQNHCDLCCEEGVPTCPPPPFSPPPTPPMGPFRPSPTANVPGMPNLCLGDTVMSSDSPKAAYDLAVNAQAPTFEDMRGGNDQVDEELKIKGGLMEFSSAPRFNGETREEYYKRINHLLDGRVLRVVSALEDLRPMQRTLQSLQGFSRRMLKANGGGAENA